MLGTRRAPTRSLPKHRSIRLKDFDYTQPGAFFITICTHQRENLLGKVVEDQVALSKFGRIVKKEWNQTAKLRTGVVLDEYVIMPNHLHGIIMLTTDPGGEPGAATEVFGKPVPGSLPTIVRSFKGAATKRINRLRNSPGHPFWQRNYFEHVIRNDNSLNRIREYIAMNPRKWHQDRYNQDHGEAVDSW